jgi:hypothetical protein
LYTAIFVDDFISSTIEHHHGEVDVAQNNMVNYTNDGNNACDEEDGDKCVKAKFVQLIRLVAASFTKRVGLDPKLG